MMLSVPRIYIGCVILSLIVGISAGQADPPAAPGQPVVEGQVLDHRGAGVGDVEVTLKAAGDAADQLPLLTTRTNDLGDFTLNGEKRLSGEFEVTFHKDGYADVSRDVTLALDGLPPFVDFVLPGQLHLAGRVISRNEGSPVAGARVRVSVEGKEWSTTTGDDGTFRVEQLLPGDATVLVSADGFATALRPVASVAAADALSVELDPERKVIIDVFTNEGEGIGGVEVSGWDPHLQQYQSAATDESGRAIFRGVSHETASMRVRLIHSQYVSDAGYDRELLLSNDEPITRRRFTMDASGRVRGRVVHAKTGEPMGGVRVTIGDGSSLTPPRDWTGFEGRFDVRSVPPGPSIVSTYLSGSAPQLESIVVVSGETVEVDFKIKPSDNAGGVVVDDEGAPVAGALIDASRWRHRSILGLIVMTGSDGRFTLSSIPSEPIEITVSAEGFETLEAQEITPGKTDHRIVLSHGQGQASVWPTLKVGEAFPPIEVVTLDGQRIKTVDLKGKVVLVDFWATWCGPCVEEIPTLVDIHKTYGTRDDFEMIGISLDFDPDVNVFQRFIDEKKMGWKHVFGRGGKSSDAADACRVSAIPQTYVIDRNGVLRESGLYATPLKAAIGRMLGKPTPSP